MRNKVSFGNIHVFDVRKRLEMALLKMAKMDFFVKPSSAVSFDRKAPPGSDGRRMSV